MLMLRRGLMLGALLLVGALVGLVSDRPLSGPVTALPPDTPSFLRLAVQGSWISVGWAAHYPVYVAVLAAAVLVPWTIATLVSLIPRRVTKDPQRLYSTGQRAAASTRAGGRCEMEGIFFTRCRRAGCAGDHWFPHSLGGATSMDNQVWACTTCNSRKGAKVPTFWQTARLEARRRRYFPTGVATRPGERLSL